MSSPSRQRSASPPPLRLPRRVPRFTLLLSTALVFLVATPLLGVSPLGIMAGKLILTALIVVAVSELHRSQSRIGLGLAVGAISAEWANTVTPIPGLYPVALATRAVLFSYIAGVVLYRVLRQATVTLDTIAGAACVYLFIGFMWAMLFALLDHLAPGSLHFPEAWTRTPAGLETARYVYFSFVTLTTLGYGDIVPRAVDASGLVVAEAVVGQLYLAVLVARLVGLHLAGPKERED